MKTRYARSIVIAVIVAVTTPVASAQQYVYPSKGQNAQQQKKDEGE